MLIKIHKGYRKTIALSDKELLNKTFTEDKKEIVMHPHFFEGEKTNKQEVIGILKDMQKEDATFKTNKPFVWDPTTDGYNYVSASHVFQKITKHSGVPAEQLQAEFIRRSKLIHGLYSRKIFGFHDVQQVINDYYKDPDGTTRTYGV